MLQLVVYDVYIGTYIYMCERNDMCFLVAVAIRVSVSVFVDVFVVVFCSFCMFVCLCLYADLCMNTIVCNFVTNLIHEKSNSHYIR